VTKPSTTCATHIFNQTGGFADPQPAIKTHGWVSLAVGLNELVLNVLGTVAPDDDDEKDDDDGGSDPNNDCGRFAITETLKDLRISTVQHLGLFFFWFFLMVCSGLGLDFLVFSLVFNMALATFRVIKCSNFKMKKS
jgi:hypothetical protein